MCVVCVCLCVRVVTPKLEKLQMAGHKGTLCSCNEPTKRRARKCITVADKLKVISELKKRYSC